MNNGNSQNQFQARAAPCCASMMSPRFKLPAAMITPTAAEPMAPRKAYLEFEAQPARMTPYTPTEVSASTYSSPAFTSAITRFGSSGITAQIANAGISVIIGAIWNSTLLEALGITTSLISSLMTSANG